MPLYASQFVPARGKAGEHEFEQTEYDELRAQYYNEVVVKNVELPSGRTLREQRRRRPPRIERDSQVSSGCVPH